MVTDGLGYSALELTKVDGPVVAELRESLCFERARNAELLALVRDLTVAKAQVLPQLDAPPPLPEAVLRAIESRSAPDSQEERQLRKAATEFLRRGEPEDAVVNRILDGEKVGWE